MLTALSPLAYDPIIESLYKPGSDVLGCTGLVDISPRFLMHSVKGSMKIIGAALASAYSDAKADVSCSLKQGSTTIQLRVTKVLFNRRGDVIDVEFDPITEAGTYDVT